MGANTACLKSAPYIKPDINIKKMWENVLDETERDMTDMTMKKTASVNKNKVGSSPVPSKDTFNPFRDENALDNYECYRCVEAFTMLEYNEEGKRTGRVLTIPADTVWKRNVSPLSAMLSYRKDVLLESEQEEKKPIELSEFTLNRFFTKIIKEK